MMQRPRAGRKGRERRLEIRALVIEKEAEIWISSCGEPLDSETGAESGSDHARIVPAVGSQHRRAALA